MFKIGDILNDRYLLISHIATGGTAKIYKTKDLKNKKICTIKISLEEILKSEIKIRRFILEAKITRNLIHPNIISVYELGIYQNYFYIVTEFINGKSLSNKIENNEISHIQSCQILLQICEALDYIHTRCIVHRDIKPDNILFSKKNVKLIDFGVALDLTNKKKDDLMMVGSVYYSAPEILQNKVINKLSDIYSLGITFYEMITGKLPFDKGNHFSIAKKQISEEIPLPIFEKNNVPKEIKNIILKATQKNPLDRYQDIKEIKKDLLSFLKKIKII